MCLLLFYMNPDAGENDLYLVLANVRDETYNRPTKPAEFWENHPNVIGGMDLEPGKAGGTWLAMNKSGKIGILLNILQPDEEILPNKKGRGFLVVDYVTSKQDYLNYLQTLCDEASDYNGFLMLTMDYSSQKDPKLACFTNAKSMPPTQLKPGFHAFGNSITPDTPWPKVSVAKEKFSALVTQYSTTATKDVLLRELLLMLRSPTRYGSDKNMEKQGKSKSAGFIQKLSSIFVRIPEANYGSRCHTIITIDGSGNVGYHENSREENSTINVEEWTLQHYSFKLE